MEKIIKIESLRIFQEEYSLKSLFECDPYKKMESFPKQLFIRNDKGITTNDIVVFVIMEKTTITDLSIEISLKYHVFEHDELSLKLIRVSVETAINL